MYLKICWCICVFSLAGINHALCQERPQEDMFYKKDLRELQKAIKNNFFDAKTGFYKRNLPTHQDSPHQFSYLWPLCALLQADNEIEKVDSVKGLVKKTLKIIQQYYNPAAPAPGYDSYIIREGGGARFYDDNEWIGLALMDAYFRTSNRTYLHISKQIYRFIMTGFDTVAGGGIYWKEGDHSSKNTCSNGPGILLALQLYKATHEKNYLDTALLLYRWVNKKLRAPSGLYYDNLKTRTGRISKHFYSYNSGTMLESNVYLYELLKKQEYLQRAIRLADTSVSYFCGSGQFRDGYWFNAVLLRAYQELRKVDNNRKYIKLFRECTGHALKNDRNKSGLMGKNKPDNLVNQAGMLEILARLSLITSKNNRNIRQSPN